MPKPVALVTGAGGEMGRALLPVLARGFGVVATDLTPLDDDLHAHCIDFRTADVRDERAMAALLADHDPVRVYHLAAVLSAHAERDPLRAHAVNVQATVALLALCRDRAGTRPLAFAFPSSIAVYGLGRAAKDAIPPVREWERTEPTAAYGCNKLYAELLGSYLAEQSGGRLDFRSIRFPGLLSAESLPTGGTTDYAPAMVHAAARGEPYECFVAESARLPFMTMPDAIAAFERLMDAPAERLGRRVYNARGFSASAGEIARAVRASFPAASIRFAPVAERQALVDTWPADVDDRAARADWGFAPAHDLEGAIRDYLAPALRARYAPSKA